MEKVIVNGKPTELEDVRCTRCVQNTSVPGISFDKNGVCNFCALHDKMTLMFPDGEAGKKELNRIFDILKRKGKKKSSTYKR